MGNSILYVKKDGRCFFAIAEPLTATEKVNFVDSLTKEVLNPNQIKYELIEIRNGKKHQTLGYINSLKEGTHYLRVGTWTVWIDEKTIEYINQRILIIEKVYELE